MIEPVNGHLLIEPVEHESFIAGKETYEEIGVVVSMDENVGKRFYETQSPKERYPTLHTEVVLRTGDKVFFDSWLAAKYPTGDGKFFWLVKWEDVRAVEKQNVES